MVLFTTLVGLILAPVFVSSAVLSTTLVAMVMAVAGVNALNMYVERDVDGLMERTRERPLPAGRLDPNIALILGLIFSFSGFTLMGIVVNLLSAFLLLIAIVSYVMIYTPMKQVSHWALPVGAIPGAMPPLVGWVAATGSIDWPALILFLIIFLWQIPHFHAIALFRGDDYANAGFKTLAVEKGGLAARRQSALAAGLLLPISLFLLPLPSVGALYAVLATLLGGTFFVVSLFGLKRETSLSWARTLFFISLIYLSVLYAVLLIP